MKSLILSILALPTLAFAADKYQVTGPVVEVSDTKLVVEGRGKERHEFVRSADTKVTGEIKVGSKVTVQYVMTAATVEVKDGDKAGGKAKPEATTDSAKSSQAPKEADRAAAPNPTAAEKKK
jgi:hypothetical protein